MTEKLTYKQAHGLRGIINSGYHDGCEPVDNYVWTWSANPFHPKNAQSFGGVVASLRKRGMARIASYRDHINGRERTERVICITVKGAIALCEHDLSQLEASRKEAEMSDDRFYSNGSAKAYNEKAKELRQRLYILKTMEAAQAEDVAA